MVEAIYATVQFYHFIIVMPNQDFEAYREEHHLFVLTIIYVVELFPSPEGLNNSTGHRLQKPWLMC
jgi:hypothetical protein